MERLDKFLSNLGLATRSQLKPILKSGRVTVNGVSARDGSVKIDPQTDAVCLDGVPVGGGGRLVLMLHKPAGYVTSTSDPRDPVVMSLIPAEYKVKDLAPVGRLDKDTEGLLLLTNDGQLAHRLISPKSGIPKVYYARHEGTAGEADAAAFAEGLTLGDGTKCLPAKLEPLGPGESLVTVVEGKYHQVRRMLASRGMPVTYLRRDKEGFLELGTLEKGQIRKLTPAEMDKLDNLT